MPATNPAKLVDPYGLAQPGVRVVAAGADVPITACATRLMENLAAHLGAQAGLVAAYGSNVVSREENVRAALAKIELGEGDAAIVHATDAASAGDAVKTLPLPPGTNVRTAHAAVVPKDAPRPDLVAAPYVAGVLVAGTIITYLVVPHPTGAGGRPRRRAWSGAPGLFGALPIAQVGLVLESQVLKPLILEG